MVCIISLCKHRLHEEEFVRPVAEIAEEFEDVRIVRKANVSGEKVIICGTALKDFEYLNRDYSWVLKARLILGICAGYQVLANLLSASLSKIERIGVHKVKCVEPDSVVGKEDFKAYFLHKLALKDTSFNRSVVQRLAVCNNEIAAFKAGKIYGLSFHPEVLNPDIIERFLTFETLENL